MVSYTRKERKLIVGQIKDQIKDFMIQYTKNRFTVDEMMTLFIYRPYSEELHYMVDEDERIHIKGDTWTVILDHNTGDFSFIGELHKYYEVDTIESIRDSFGDIYSVFNVMYDSIPVNVWHTIKDLPRVPRGKTSYQITYGGDDELKKRMLERKKAYYWEHRDEIRQKQREYYKRKNDL